MAKSSPKKAKSIPDERYFIPTTECEIKLVRYTDGGKEFEYLNRKENRANNYQDKPNFVTTNEQVERNILFKAWKLISIHT